MIANEEELAMARSRLALVEAELALLRRDVLRTERRTHDLMCEYFLRRIDQLKADITAYQSGAAKPVQPAAPGYSPTRESFE